MNKAQAFIASVQDTQVHEDGAGFLLVLDDGSAVNVMVDEYGNVTAQAVTVYFQPGVVS